MRRVAVALLVWLVLQPAGVARTNSSFGCGTHSQKAQERLHLHREWRRARQAAGTLRPFAAGAASTRVAGDIVVMDDSDGVVGQLNPFNLDRRTLLFRPASANASAYRTETRENTYSTEDAAAGTRLDLDDDDDAEVALPFAFPFFGTSYQRLWVNDDGNLTFTAGDGVTAERSLGRMTAGPPRISGLFADLDPTRSTAGVRVLARADRFVVSWPGVPEWRESGSGPSQTFQIRLYPDGRVEFAWQGTATSGAVVGLAPGRLRGDGALVSFSAGTGDTVFSALVAERFSNLRDIDVVTAAQKFYAAHEDAYDYLVFFNNMNIEADDSAVAYEMTVRNTREGIGDGTVDLGFEYGSASRLQAVMNMGPLSQYPADPYSVVPRRATARDTVMSVIAHEAGHLFLAFASHRDPEGGRTRPLLCSDNAHWSFTFNSDASLLSGNRIADNGPGVSPRFRTTATVQGFSALDRYLMGLIPPEQVGPLFYVARPTTTAGSCIPLAGVGFDGTRRDFTVNDLIDAEGRRVPDDTVSQRHFRFAFVLIAPKGAEVPQDQIDRLDSYRREFETYYARAAGGLISADTSLRKSLKLSLYPAAGVLAGQSANATVSIASPAEGPLSVLLRQETGAVIMPSAVIIPAGATQAAFTLRGAREGVDRISAEASSSYERATAAVQVLPELGTGLKLEVVSGNRQPLGGGGPLPEAVVVRARDVNGLPYPGLRLLAATSAGSVSPAVAVTDADGLARFTWTPGAGGPPLRISVEGAAGAGPVEATVAGRPAIAPGSIVNAASFQAGLAPGGIATLFGSHLAAGVSASAGQPYGTDLSGVRVQVAGRPAIVYFVSDGQINFVTPREAVAGPAEVVVSTPAGQSAPVTASVVPYQPAIFATGVVLRGGFAEIYCTGLGAVASNPALGVELTLAQPVVSMGGRTAGVVFSGMSPGFPGLYQVNVQLPQGLAGSVPVSLEIGGVRSNEIQAVLP